MYFFILFSFFCVFYIINYKAVFHLSCDIFCSYFHNRKKGSHTKLIGVTPLFYMKIYKIKTLSDLYKTKNIYYRLPLIYGFASDSGFLFFPTKIKSAINVII